MTPVWKNKQFLLGLGFAVCSMLAATLYVVFAGSYNEGGQQSVPLVERLGLRQPQKAAPEAKINLSAEKNKITLGDNWQITANLEVSGVDVTGTDVVVSYDPTYLRFMETENAGNFGRVLSTQSGEGLIALSGVMDPGTTFSGEGEIANLTFEALKVGETEIKLVTKDMAKGESSGVIASVTGNNILKPFSSSLKCSIIEEE